MAGCRHVLQVVAVHLLVHQRVDILVDEAARRVDRRQVLFRLPIVGQSPFTLQISRAYLVRTELFQHTLVKDLLLFLAEHAILELKLLFVLLHRLCLFLSLLHRGELLLPEGMIALCKQVGGLWVLAGTSHVVQRTEWNHTVFKTLLPLADG